MPAARRRSRAWDEDIKTIRRLFIAGCFFLPFLWGISCLHFRKKAKRADAPDELKIWYRRGLIGFWVAAAAFVAWIVVFQLAWRTVPGLASLLVVPAEDIGGVDPW